ncbi:unnamed protein product [Cunninghamella echinulata]
MSDTGICSNNNNYSSMTQQFDVSLASTISLDAPVPNLSVPVEKKPALYEYMVHCTMTDLLQLENYRLTIIEESNTKTAFRMDPVFTVDLDDDELTYEKKDKTNKEVMTSLQSYNEPYKVKIKELVTLDPDAKAFVLHLPSPSTSPSKNDYDLENVNQLTSSMKKLTNKPYSSSTSKSMESRSETINNNIIPSLPSLLDEDNDTIYELKSNDDGNNNIHNNKYVITTRSSSPHYLLDNMITNKNNDGRINHSNTFSTIKNFPFTTEFQDSPSTISTPTRESPSSAPLNIHNNDDGGDITKGTTVKLSYTFEYSPSASFLNKGGNIKKKSLDPMIPEYIPPKYLAKSLTTESKIKTDNNKKLNPEVPSFIPMMHQHENENNEYVHEYENENENENYEHENGYDDNEYENGYDDNEYQYQYDDNEYENGYDDNEYENGYDDNEYQYQYDENEYEYQYDDNEYECQYDNKENKNILKLDPKATIFIPPTSIKIESSKKHLIIAPTSSSISSYNTPTAPNTSTITSSFSSSSSSSSTPTSSKSASTIKSSLNVHSTPFVPQQHLETTATTTTTSSSSLSSSKRNPLTSTFNIHSAPFIPRYAEENSTNEIQLSNPTFHIQPLPLALRPAPASLSPSALLASSFHPDS